MIRGEQDPLLRHLAHCFPRAEAVDIAVAFVLERGVECLRPYLEDHLLRQRRLRLVTGDYYGVTEPNGLERLLDLEMAPGRERTCELRVFESRGRSFHPKAYLFDFGGGEGIAFVGSSNLSQTALGNGVEWNYRVVRSRDGAGFDAVRDGFEQLFRHERTLPLTHEWIGAYGKRRPVTVPRDAGAIPEELPPPEPHAVQEAALKALRETRDAGNVAGLVVLATGLGKTWLGAFDSRAFGRVLFVAHREEILEQARTTYRRIRSAASLGLFTGRQKDREVDVLFASVQTLGRSAHLAGFEPDHFDYVVVDEFHHASAATYRRLIEHFRPRFLLGLTATPERTDGADLLALCGDNLVYRCDLGDGIRHGLLAGIDYHGVPDDVDYAQIPWRSNRFDEDELTRALATERRADNAFGQHERLGGRRTLAFCVSQRHADFMAHYFTRRGKRALAVHAGSTSAPRANTLAALRDGELDVVFSVDMFNEGVDVPAIDTVLMLRPTESRIVWLQQLGRGLRKAEGKTALRVIDYIGNHRTFLDKPRALLATLLGIGDSHDDLRAALMAVQRGEAGLPPGCSVTYELEAFDILQQLLQPGDRQARLRVAYEEFRGRHGRRPTAAEMHRSGYLTRGLLRQASTFWHGFVGAMGDLSADARAVLQQHEGFLREVEQSPMQRSYKMLLLQSMIELDALPGTCTIREAAERLHRLAARSPKLRVELETSLAGGTSLINLVRSEPIRAWTGTKRGKGSRYFVLQGDAIATRFEVDEHARSVFIEFVRELVEWRLSEYLDRSDASSFVCSVTHNGRHPILMLPQREQTPGLPEGAQAVVVDGERFEATFAKIAVNVLRRVGGDETNALPELLRSWFGKDAGKPGRGEKVRFTAKENGYVLAPVLHRSEQLAVRSRDGKEMDAHFHVEDLGDHIAVVYMSRGGTKGSKTVRNVDYTAGLDALLQRAGESGFRLERVLLDSLPARKTSWQERLLRFEEVGGEPLPLDLAITDTQRLRRWIAKAQR
ncbi:MAG TPA: DEAD/DEAH box helicase family protein, partial [Planctomycetota bacterium]